MDINEAIAHIEIWQVLCTYARGIDRLDLEARLSIYHPEGTDSHGAMFEGLGSEFANLQQQMMASVQSPGQHHMTNMLIEFEGENDARVESYYLAFHPYGDADGTEKLGIMGGRYLDHFQRRDGSWKILSRRTLVDFTREQLEGGPWTQMVGQFPEGKHQAEGDESYAFFE